MSDCPAARRAAATAASFVGRRRIRGGRASPSARTTRSPAQARSRSRASSSHSVHTPASGNRRTRSSGRSTNGRSRARAGRATVGTSECPGGQRHGHQRVAEPDHAEILSVACRFRNEVPNDDRPTAIPMPILRRWDRRPAPRRLTGPPRRHPLPGGFPLPCLIGRARRRRSAEHRLHRSPTRPPPARPASSAASRQRADVTPHPAAELV